jgi:hypothetical protein
MLAVTWRSTYRRKGMSQKSNQVIISSTANLTLKCTQTVRDPSRLQSLSPQSNITFRFGRVVKATDSNSSTPCWVLAICWVRPHRFKSCSCRFLFCYFDGLFLWSMLGVCVGGCCGTCQSHGRKMVGVRIKIGWMSQDGKRGFQKTGCSCNATSVINGQFNRSVLGP